MEEEERAAAAGVGGMEKMGKWGGLFFKNLALVIGVFSVKATWPEKTVVE